MFFLLHRRLSRNVCTAFSKLKYFVAEKKTRLESLQDVEVHSFKPDSVGETEWNALPFPRHFSSRSRLEHHAMKKGIHFTLAVKA